jgi:hypothetical protein
MNAPGRVTRPGAKILKGMAGPTRLELATSGVTGRRSNQLNYDPASDLATTPMGAGLPAKTRGLWATREGWWAVQDLNL